MSDKELLIDISNAISSLEGAASMLKNLINPISDNYRIAKDFEVDAFRAKKALRELEQKL